ncbi:MAG: epoxyqueuosine reductase [Brevinematales bacterium]|nr:epoxyqueuosine reductase [Brevinematales bacterium]
MDSKQIKQLALDMGADLCGIASEERFAGAPEGFRPRDIYSKCRSVAVVAKRVPHECLNAESCVPYTQINNIVMQETDRLVLALSLALQDKGIPNVMVPTDDPYEYWEAENSYGRAILSLRHAGRLAGLGYLGNNTLLINPRYGNMIQLGAILLGIDLEPDEVLDMKCPDGCRLCIDNCPAHALDGTTVKQKDCRPLSNFKNKKGYNLKKCFICRKVCPNALGTIPGI